MQSSQRGEISVRPRSDPAGTALVVSSERSGDHLEVRVRGEIDLATVHHFEEQLEQAGEAVEEDSRVVIDLSECTFIDSTGIAVLAKTCKDERPGQSTFRLGATSPVVNRVLDLAGLSGALVRER